ncbi:hypothetical protein [Sphingobium xenophagum]|nr:hypothetical protein [uncultured Sphingobium sp.]|tara:strand:- start:9826 stop:10464 length:639 start_codon:yes stop_codon:yes gene_type:complete
MDGDRIDETIVNDAHNALATEIGRRARRLALSDNGSDAALADIMEMLRLIGITGRQTLDFHFPAENSVDEIEGRSNWMKAIHYLEGTHIIPGLSDLWLALTELVRGQQLPSISPVIAGKGSGSRTTHHELLSKKYAVEAAHQIRSLCAKDAENVARLRACGTNPRTLQGFADQCNEAGPMFWIDESSFSDLGLADAERILKAQIQILSIARA